MLMAEGSPPNQAARQAKKPVAVEVTSWALHYKLIIEQDPEQSFRRRIWLGLLIKQWNRCESLLSVIVRVIVSLRR